MKQLFIWISVVVLLSAAVFSGAFVRFDHFWQEWEFLAAATAAVYNLFFAVVVYASRHEEGEGTLHDALADSVSITIHLLLRVSLPSFLFVGTTIVILCDRQEGGGPVSTHSVMLKLLLTLAAFITVWTGDLVTAHRLRGVDPEGPTPSAWISYFKRRAWLIDSPFVVAYTVLTFLYMLYRYDSANLAKGNAFALLLQAFVGGASALEMMIQSAIHGFSEIGD